MFCLFLFFLSFVFLVLFCFCFCFLFFYPARIAEQGIILLQFLLLCSSSSSVCQHVNISETLCPTMLIPGHNNKSANGHFWHDLFGVKGQVRFTRSKGHFHQKCNFSFRLHGMVIGLLHIHQLDTLYKSHGSRYSPGVIWGHMSQKVIFTKNAISPSYYMVWSCDSWCFISLTPLQKFWI